MPRASQKLPLDGWYVISLRPLKQHGGVRRSASNFGASVFALSTLRLQALAADGALREALRCSRVIVTSPAAASFAGAGRPLASRRGQRWFALGAGSAAALRRQGIAQVLLPENGADSEALLAHPALADVAGERIGLLTAPGGRGLIAHELAARGATVVVAEVYARQAIAPSPSRLRALSTLPDSTALLLTSAEAFEVLWNALDADGRRRLRQRPCISSSARLGALARERGFQQVLRAPDAQPASLIATLLQDVGGRRFR